VSEPQLETLRIHEANERTWLAWIRTGVALMAFGFAILRLASPGPGSPAMGAGFIALGALLNPIATARYARIRHALQRGELGAPSATLVYAFGIAATLAGIAMCALAAQSTSAPRVQ
jgi:putative membrane protein